MNIDLTKGKIKGNLVRLSLPIVATGFIQTAYSLVDMLWIGRLGSGALSAVSSAGFYMWFAAAVMMLGRTGTEILVSQATGENNQKKAKKYARSGIAIASVLAVVFSIALYFLKEPLVGIFNIDDVEVNEMAISYLGVVTIGLFFDFFTQVFTGIFIGRGNSKLPFVVNAIGLVVNIFLDPFLIFGYGTFKIFFPELEVSGFSGIGFIGAAWATTISKIIIFFLFIYYIKVKHYMFNRFVIFKRSTLSAISDILKLGALPSVYNGTFCVFSILLTRIVSGFGIDAIAASRVGSQIESISWMTAQGFSIALGTFTGQNYGAKIYSRVTKGYIEANKIAIVLGLINTFIIYFGAEPLSSIFFPLAEDAKALEICVDYMRILAFSQLFMCVEITTTGSFNGIGKTVPPSIVSIVMNCSRIPLAIFLSSIVVLGVNGIWITVSGTSVVKAIWITLWFCIMVKKSDKLSFKNMEVDEDER
ncbi:MAG: MATE family efflux transporter [Lachnospirales bacterium]